MFYDHSTKCLQLHALEGWLTSILHAYITRKLCMLCSRDDTAKVMITDQKLDMKGVRSCIPYTLMITDQKLDMHGVRSCMPYTHMITDQNATTDAG